MANSHNGADTMPKGTIASDGTATIIYNPYNGDKLYTNQGTAHLLPCEKCGDVLTVSLKTVSVLCPECFQTADVNVSWHGLGRVETDTLMDAAKNIPSESWDVKR